MLKNGSPRSSLIPDSNSWGAPTSGTPGGYTPPGIGLSSSPTMGPGLSGLGAIAPLSMPSPASYGSSAQDTINNIYAPPSAMDTSAGATRIPGINTPSVSSPSVNMTPRIGVSRMGLADIGRDAQPMGGQRLMA